SLNNLPANCSSANVTFVWSDTAGAGGNFDIEIASQPTFGGFIVDSSTGIPENPPPAPNPQTYTSSFAFLTATTYYWHVQAHNGQGDSGWSPTFSFRTKIDTPTTTAPGSGVYLVDNRNNDVTNWPPNNLFQWNSVTGASGYQLQVAPTTLFNTLVLNVSLPY